MTASGSVSGDGAAGAGVSRPQCRARSKRTGQRCQRPPMLGQSVCYHHGGATPGALAAAKRRLAIAKAGELLGVPREVNPEEALLEALYLAAGDTERLKLEVAQLEERLVEPTLLGGAVDVRVKLYHDAVERQAKLAKLALDAGIAERAVRIKELQAAALVAGIVYVLDHDELGLSHLQRRRGRELIRHWLLQQRPLQLTPEAST